MASSNALVVRMTTWLLPLATSGHTTRWHEGATGGRMQLQSCHLNRRRWEILLVKVDKKLVNFSLTLKCYMCAMIFQCSIFSVGVILCSYVVILFLSLIYLQKFALYHCKFNRFISKCDTCLSSPWMKNILFECIMIRSFSAIVGRIMKTSLQPI